MTSIIYLIISFCIGKMVAKAILWLHKYNINNYIFTTIFLLIESLHDHEDDGILLYNKYSEDAPSETCYKWERDSRALYVKYIDFPSDSKYHTFGVELKSTVLIPGGEEKLNGIIDINNTENFDDITICTRNRSSQWNILSNIDYIFNGDVEINYDLINLINKYNKSRKENRL